MTAVPATLRLRREGTLRSRAARGDAAAFAAVYERHHQALYRYCRSILRHDEDAQDALQSTMTKAFAALQDEPRDFDLRPWLFRIAHNEAISILRRRRATEELDDVAEPHSIEDRVLEREELRALRMDLADLPDRQRAALVLRELNGLSHAEIATVLDLTPTAVKHTLFEARSSLFSCREGREMHCHDVRRMLSDGDGRVLRGRGVRAHLRSCTDCRRFRDDLRDRPVALRLLAPPLPAAAAASLFSQLVGGTTAAKLLACVALAGGGATLAVEVQQARRTPPAAAAEKRKPERSTLTKPVAVTTTPQPQPEPTVAAAKPGTTGPQPHAKPKPRRATAKTVPVKTPAARVKHDAPKPKPPATVEPVKDKAPKPDKAAKQEEQAARQEEKAAKKEEREASREQRAEEKVPPGPARKGEAGVPPGHAKKEERTALPGQAKKDERTEPPGQANKQGRHEPPGQAKQDDKEPKPDKG